MPSPPETAIRGGLFAMHEAPGRSAGVMGFGLYEVDLRSGELRKAGTRIALQEQPRRVLARLLRQPGELVTREQLRRELWPDNTFVDFEHGLNAAVKRLREALGDSAENPRFIETLPRRGYRFIAPVVVPGPASEAPPDAPAHPSATAATGEIRSRRWASRGWTAAAVLLVAGAMAAVAWWRPSSPGDPSRQEPEAPSSVSQSRIVAVSALENRSDDPALGRVGEQVAGRLVAAIAQMPGVEAVVERAGTSPQGDPDAGGSAGGRTAGASLIVEGAMFLHGDRLELQSRIVDAASGRLLHAFAPLTAPRDAPEDAMVRLERQVAGAVAIHFDDFFGGLVNVSDTPTIEAYREYRAGLEIFAWDYARSLAHLQRALDADPGFWLPRVIMFFAYGNMGQSEHSLEQLAAMDRHRDRRSPSERLFIDFLREDMAGRREAALRLLRDLEMRMPRSLLVNHNIVQLALTLNDPRAAVAAYDGVVFDVRTLRHSIGTYRLTLLTKALHMLGEHDRELEESRRSQQEAPGMLTFIEGEVRALAALGRLDELHAAVDRSLAISATQGTPGDVLEAAALGLRAHGHGSASLALAARAVEWRQTRPGALAGTSGNRAALGRALYLAGRWAEAEDVFARLRSEEPDDPDAIGHIGVCAARRGDASRARAVDRRLQELSDPHLPGYHTFWRARVAAALGAHAEATALLRDALAEEPPYGLHLYHTPDFESLREYPPFQALVRPKG